MAEDKDSGFVKISDHDQPATSAVVLENISDDEARKVYDELRKNFDDYQTSRARDAGRWDYEYRIRNLKGLVRFITENEATILAASNKDVGRSTGEWTLERAAILGDLRVMIRKLWSWMKPSRRSTPLWMKPGKSYVSYEAYGVTLVIGTWNYGITTSILPLAGALAAGNACVLKPSEISHHQALVMAQLLPHYVDPACCRVILGDAVHAASLVDNIPWDFLFFTGSVRVGGIIGSSCAKRNIPCALELGGKSPTIVDKSCDLGLTVRRIVQSKFANCGATCVAPDYLLIIGDDARKSEVMKAIDKEIIRQHGTDVAKSSQYGHIVNDMQFKRLESLMSGGKVFRGGHTESSKLFIEPTLLDEVDLDSPLMQEEIFGPLLPVIQCQDIDTAINFIRARPKPLALYIFSSNSANVEKVLSRTTAGSACVNEAILQYLNPYLPFGGVGTSGTGAYHGESSFREFSHEKSVMWRSAWFDPRIRYYPLLGKKNIQAMLSCYMAL